MGGGLSVRAAFNQGQVPTIACFNQATSALGVSFDQLIPALQKFVDDYFAPVWGTPARLAKATGFVQGNWAIAFLEDADVANALGYHDLTPDGLPLAKVFVRTTLEAGDQVSVTASHELAEMLADPAINLYSTGPNAQYLYAYETADPVEEESFSVDGISMSDFVFPSYFEVFRKANSVQFDQMNKVTKPFQILKGGYQIVWRNGKVSQIFGSAAKRKRFAKEDRRGHRSTYRVQKPKRRSKAHWGEVLEAY